MTTDCTLRAEWDAHGAVMLAWPHSQTDWAYMLDEVQQCYRRIIDALVGVGEHVVLLAPTAEVPTFDSDKITVVNVDTNDTWIRDYGPLTLTSERLLDFRFNAWGQKFASNFDNQTTAKLARMNLLDTSVECHKDFVLEGGAIESDGQGTIMTTACCLLAPNRNEPMSKAEIESQLLKRLHARKILWLDVEPLAGDDTDGHVDTICRLAPNNTIIYSPVDGLEKQLRELTNAAGEKFKLVELPLPDAICDPDDGSLLPATYANYLVTDNAVLLPTYRQPDNDARAVDALKSVFRTRKIVTVDCCALIRQHGSLHCATMQIPRNVLNL